MRVLLDDGASGDGKWQVVDKQTLRDLLLEMHRAGVDMSKVSVWRPARVSVELAIDFQED